MSFNALTSWSVPVKFTRRHSQSLEASIVDGLMSHSLVYTAIRVISKLEGININVKLNFYFVSKLYLETRWLYQINQPNIFKVWNFFLTCHCTSGGSACYSYYFTLKAKEQVWKCCSISISLLGILQYRMFSQNPTFWNHMDRFPNMKKTSKSGSQKLKTKEGQGELSLCINVFSLKTFMLTSFPAYFDVSDTESEAKGREFKRSEHLFPA